MITRKEYSRRLCGLDEHSRLGIERRSAFDPGPAKREHAHAVRLDIGAAKSDP
jgi:hypothetical protein